MKNPKSNFRQSPAHQSQKRILGETGAYLMSSLLHPFKNKWGISDRTDLRRGQVDNAVTGPVYTVFGREILFGWTCEQMVHWLYQLQNAPMKTGTGRMEWYWTINPIFGTAFVWACASQGWYLEWYWFALAFVSPFVWIDGLIWLVLFRLLAYVFGAVMLWAIDKIWALGIFEFLGQLFAGAMTFIQNFQ